MEQANRIQSELKDNGTVKAKGNYSDKDIGRYRGYKDNVTGNGGDVINKEEVNDSLYYDKNQGNWSMEDINHLIDRNNELGRQWRKIAMDFEGKSARQCAYMYDKISASGANKKFTRVDDIFLLDLVKVHGCNWHLIQSKMTKFSIVQLRNRYNKVLLSKLLNDNSKRKIATNKLYKLRLKKKDNGNGIGIGIGNNNKDNAKDNCKDIEMKNDINTSDAVTGVTQCDYHFNQPKPYSTLNFSFSPFTDTNSNTNTLPSPIQFASDIPVDIQKSILMRYNSNSNDNSNNGNISNNNPTINNQTINNQSLINEKTVNDNMMDNKDLIRKELVNKVIALFNKLKVLLKILLNENKKMESKYQSPELKVFNTLLIQKMKRILLNYQRVMKEGGDLEDISETMMELIKNQSKLIQLGKINSKLYRTLNGLFEALHSNLPD